jgi:hypothetical protein
MKGGMDCLRRNKHSSARKRTRTCTNTHTHSHTHQPPLRLHTGSNWMQLPVTATAECYAKRRTLYPFTSTIQVTHSLQICKPVLKARLRQYSVHFSHGRSCQPPATTTTATGQDEAPATLGGLLLCVVLLLLLHWLVNTPALHRVCLCVFVCASVHVRVCVSTHCCFCVAAAASAALVPPCVGVVFCVR